MQAELLTDDLALTLVPAVDGPGRLRHHRLEDMAGGWFVGDFSPAALRWSGAEVAVKHLSAGTREPSHEHRIATEVTLVLSGEVRLGGRAWADGDIVVLPPGTPAAFEAVTNAVLVVVKTPSVPGDKHPASPLVTVTPV